LWYSNTTNYGGAGTITVTNGITSNPAFAADGYHITADSMAIDKGMNAGVTTDIDNQLRPNPNKLDGKPDLGADGIISKTRGKGLTRRASRSSNGSPHFSWQATLDTGVFLAYAQR
jgi:hypothetical protein